MEPSFAVRQIANFVLHHAAPHAQLLDIGAGRGQIAALLAKSGINVTAIDRSEKSIGLARVNGVEVVQADITTYETATRFDAVLFSMVAHHVHPLDQALDRARELLKPGGKLLVEDFGVEGADTATATWYYDTLAALSALDLMGAGHAMAGAVEEPLKTWRHDHSDDHHPFNTGGAILASIQRRFEILQVERGPYFYRYVAAAIADHTGVDRGAALLELERRIIGADRIRPLGLRIVAAR